MYIFIYAIHYVKMAYFGQNYLVMVEINRKNKKETFEINIKGMTHAMNQQCMCYMSFPESYAVVEN